MRRSLRRRAVYASTRVVSARPRRAAVLGVAWAKRRVARMRSRAAGDKAGVSVGDAVASGGVGRSVADVELLMAWAPYSLPPR